MCIILLLYGRSSVRSYTVVIEYLYIMWFLLLVDVLHLIVRHLNYTMCVHQCLLCGNHNNIIIIVLRGAYAPWNYEVLQRGKVLPITSSVPPYMQFLLLLWLVHFPCQLLLPTFWLGVN